MTGPRPSLLRRLTRVRMSLRLSMGVILVVAISLSWIITRARRQAETVEMIRRAGGEILFDWESGTRDQKDPGPKWLTNLVGPDFNHNVTSVVLPKDAPNLDGFWVPRLIELHRLESLRLHDCPSLTDAGLAQLAGLSRLEGLGLSGTRISGGGFAHLRGMSELRRVDAMGVPTVDDDLANFSGLTRLRSLVIQGDRISDAGLEYLRPLVDLESLQIPSKSTMQITSAGLSHLSGMPKLFQLNLFASRVESLEPLRGLTSLQVLHFLDADLDDEDLAPLSALPQLRLLSLAGKGERFGDAGLAHLGGVKSIEYVWLVDTNVGDAGLIHLAKLPKLSELYLDGTRLTDEGLIRLVDFPNLTTLSLNRTAITDDGLVPLAQLARCVKISLKETKATEAGIAALKAKMPWCKIEY